MSFGGRRQLSGNHARPLSALENKPGCHLLFVGGGSDPRNRRHIIVDQASGANVGYGASILGEPMSATATVLPVDAPVHIHKCLHKSDDLMPLVNLV
jgi:hypothetical protein